MKECCQLSSQLRDPFLCIVPLALGKGLSPLCGDDFMSVEASGICGVVLSNPKAHTCGTLTGLA